MIKILLIFLVSVIALNKTNETVNTTSRVPVDEFPFMSYVMAFKGLMNGIQRGLYHKEYFKLSEKCMGSDEDLNQDFRFIYEFINGRVPPSKVLEFVKTIQRLTLNQMEECGYTKSIRDL